MLIKNYYKWGLRPELIDYRYKNEIHNIFWIDKKEKEILCSIDYFCIWMNLYSISNFIYIKFLKLMARFKNW